MVRSPLGENVESAAVALLVSSALSSLNDVLDIACHFVETCLSLQPASIATGLGTDGHGSVVDRWQSQ